MVKKLLTPSMDCNQIFGVNPIPQNIFLANCLDPGSGQGIEKSLFCQNVSLGLGSHLIPFWKLEEKAEKMFREESRFLANGLK